MHMHINNISRCSSIILFWHSLNYLFILFQLGIQMMSMIASGALYYLTIGFQLPQTQPILRAMITLIAYQI